MKKILILFIVVCLAAPVFADDSSGEPKSTLYGKFRLDYDLDDQMVENKTYAGFNIDRARFGFTTIVTDLVEAKLELEFKPSSTAKYGNFELRIAEVDWTVINSFMVSAGRMYEAFAPQETIDHASRFDGIGGTVDLGIVRGILQVGNDKDAGFNGDHIIMMPGIVFAPEIEGLAIEAGINGKFKFTTDQATSQMSANAYCTLGVAGLSAIVNFIVNRLDDSAMTQFDLYVDLSYKTDVVSPGILVSFYDLSDNIGGTHLDLDPYLAFAVTKGLTIKTLVGVNNVVGDNDLGWEFTLRFEWSPRVKF